MLHHCLKHRNIHVHSHQSVSSIASNRPLAISLPLKHPPHRASLLLSVTMYSHLTNRWLITPTTQFAQFYSVWPGRNFFVVSHRKFTGLQGKGSAWTGSARQPRDKAQYRVWVRIFHGWNTYIGGDFDHTIGALRPSSEDEVPTYIRVPSSTQFSYPWEI